MLIAGITYRYWPNDERDVRRHLIHLAEALSLPGAETDVARLTRIAVVREYFAPDVRVIVDGEEIVSRQALIGRLTAWTPPPGGFSVEFVDETLELAADRSTARIVLTAQVVSKDLQTGEAIVDGRDMTIAMAKAQGDWVITKAESLGRP
jgi:hypothetical protein